MRTSIKSLRLKNFKAFKDVVMDDIPDFCVMVGANGSGKSTIFSLFGFLKDALTGNVNTALSRLGGARGFEEVRSRNARGPIEIEIKFRIASAKKEPLITYYLEIGFEKKRAYVAREILRYRRGSRGRPWHFLDFGSGEGYAVTNELDEDVDSAGRLQRESHTLKANDILAIKGLAQFTQFPAVVAIGELIDNWHISDLHINKARPEQESGYAEQLSREGENLSLVIQYLYEHHKSVFKKIIDSLQQRIPGIKEIESRTTEEGRVLLKFRDGSFKAPFLARFVSDGTIKMLAYLTLLYAPNPHPLLCVEEPENQLYPKLLGELAEEFRLYARRGGQVFVSTHSPDFLDALEVDEVFWLEKRDGYTHVRRARDDDQIAEYMEDGDKMGRLWSEGFFGSVDPGC